MIKKEIVCI